jgi:hypothetical protein
VLSGGALATPQTLHCSGEGSTLANGDNICNLVFNIQRSATPYVATTSVTVQGDEGFSRSGSQQTQILFNYQVTPGTFVFA